MMKAANPPNNDPCYDGSCEARAPHGSELTRKDWVAEAAFRMIPNDLDPDVAGSAKHRAVYGGMGGAQPLAATLAGAASLNIECQQSGSEFRLRTRYPDKQARDIDHGLELIKYRCGRKEAASNGLQGNAAEVFTDPRAVHLQAMLDLQKLGTPTVDHGNNIRQAAFDEASPVRSTSPTAPISTARLTWPVNGPLKTAGGVSWVSLHLGGGVGMSYTQHTGMMIVAGGTEEVQHRLQRCSCGSGVKGHVDARYELAAETAKERGRTHADYALIRLPAR